MFIKFSRADHILTIIEDAIAERDDCYSSDFSTKYYSQGKG